jgi:pentatricopeptide repeat protein
MQAEGVPPNRYTFSSMMEACVNGGQPETALAVFEQMTSQGISPDVVSYTLLVRAHATPQTSRADHVPEAELRSAFATLQQMVDEGVTPNVVTFNALLSGCLLPAEPGGEPRYETALSALREMLFSRVSPTKRTFLILAATPRLRAGARAGSGSGGGRGSGTRADREIREQAPLTAARLKYFKALMADFRKARRQLDGEIYLEILRGAAVAAAAIGARSGAPAATGSDSRNRAPGSISREIAEGWIQLGLEALTERRDGAVDGRPALFNPRKVHTLQEGPLEAAILAAAPGVYATSDALAAAEQP